MASKGPVESLTEEVICPICLDFFADPVSLECGHNFCRFCITQCWEREEKNSCPECREVFADRNLRANRALANLTEKVRKLNPIMKGKESKHHCEEHEEELKLFCETDKTLICLICRDAREHREHRFMPIKEAVQIYTEQSHSLQSHITSQFAELRQIVAEKEQSLLRDLREEEEKILNLMERHLREIQENIRIIQEEITKLKEQMFQKDSVIFLKEEACRNRRINDNIQELSMTDEAKPFEKFDHPYLLNTVLRETVHLINRVSITLDVETADPWLEVSEDRKSVRLTETPRDLRDTGKRFTNLSCMLGSEGFTSGIHYWEVEVAGNRGWWLGVAAESVERKKWVIPSPETGFWVIEWVSGVTQWDSNVHSDPTSPETRLPVSPILGRVGVYLSYESGTVSFYNAETKSHVYTFTGNKFTEKLYPFFWTWDRNQWLRICSGSTLGL
ncbi:zinc-binding protein A33-like isoform X4 [Hypanus sabinus]|uniref:zinc-binding protein A33-like isoform X4 n=1 Tax=Hypanus sabinus TaxID=79690 RepID=UPI0028C38EEE|nr:zinc-binding protein A33-like isoform X4 [Hypanus sabinus]